MRMLLKIKIPVEHGNRAAADGSMKAAFENLFKTLQPEASYFSMEDGLRCAYIFYEARAEYQFLEIHEPLFASMGALVYDSPALVWDDMVEGFGKLQHG